MYVPRVIKGLYLVQYVYLPERWRSIIYCYSFLYMESVRGMCHPPSNPKNTPSIYCQIYLLLHFLLSPEGSLLGLKITLHVVPR